MQKKNQPKLDIEPRPIEVGLSWLGGVALFAALAYCLHLYPELPDRIATKFKIDGSPRSYSGKQVLFALPIIGILTWALLQYLSRHPHWYNYPFKITPDNARPHYEAGVSMMLQLNAVMSILFALITYETIHISMCECPGTMSYLGVMTMVASAAVLGLYAYRVSAIK